MYRKIEDFISDWNSEKESTIKIFSKVTEDIKSFKPNENIRSLERLAWHITQTITEMPANAKILESDVLENKPIPDSIAQIIEIYEEQSEELTKAIKDKWSDDELNDTTEIYGEQWKKTKILSILVKHQIHHRGQMTILMRLQNTVVPGIYGPAKEEWISYGMKPHE